MSIKYDIHAISNAKGEGKELQFVKPILLDPLTRKELEARISHFSTVTGSDLEAVFSAIGEVMARELSSGNRFYLPGVGYFSIQVGLTKKKDMSKVKGKHIYVNGIGFRPEGELLSRIQSKASFERLEGTTCSAEYTEAEMVEKVKKYLSSNRLLNRRVMESEFNLRCNMARNWLTRLVDMGVLEKDGSRHSPVYYLKE